MDDNGYDLKMAVREFFDFLDYQEESESGKLFHPIQVSCTRIMMHQKLNDCLQRMKEFSRPTADELQLAKLEKGCHD